MPGTATSSPSSSCRTRRRWAAIPIRRNGPSTSPSRSRTSLSLEEAKARAEAAGLDVVGVTDHTIFKSIYFRDPSGHRLEIAAWTATPEQIDRMKSVAHEMVEEWSRTKRPPRHTAWMHEKEFADAH